MTLKSNKRIAILGFNRFFSREHRIINELRIFGECYSIDGYGCGEVDGINHFVTVSKPSRLLRRFVILVGMLFPRFRIQFEKFFYKKIRAELIHQKYSFIISHNIDDSLIALGTGIPFLFHSHEYLPRQFDGDLLFRLTEMRYRDLALKQILPNAAATITEGNKVSQKYAKEYNIAPEKFLMMPSMPRYHEFDGSFKENEQNKNSKIRLIHHGILAPIRGIDFLVDVFEKLGGNYCFSLMGPGPKDFIDHLNTRSESLENLEILDPVSYDQIVGSLYGHDLGLVFFGSKHYHHKHMTVPNKFWECLQARVPVIVSPESAMADIIRDNGCGIVSESNTLDGYVNTIRKLTREDLQSMKQRCESMAWSHSRDSWIQSYRENVIATVDRHRQAFG